MWLSGLAGCCFTDVKGDSAANSKKSKTWGKENDMGPSIQVLCSNAGDLSSVDSLCSVLTLSTMPSTSKTDLGQSFISVTVLTPVALAALASLHSIEHMSTWVVAISTASNSERTTEAATSSTSGKPALRGATEQTYARIVDVIQWAAHRNIGKEAQLSTSGYIGEGVVPITSQPPWVFLQPTLEDRKVPLANEPPDGDRAQKCCALLHKLLAHDTNFERKLLQLAVTTASSSFLSSPPGMLECSHKIKITTGMFACINLTPCYLSNVSTGSLDPGIKIEFVPRGSFIQSSLSMTSQPSFNILQLSETIPAANNSITQANTPIREDASSKKGIAASSSQVDSARAWTILDSIPLMATLLDIQGQEILCQNGASKLHWGSLQNVHDGGGQMLEALFSSFPKDNSSFLSDNVHDGGGQMLEALFSSFPEDISSLLSDNVQDGGGQMLVALFSSPPKDNSSLLSDNVRDGGSQMLEALFSSTPEDISSLLLANVRDGGSQMLEALFSSTPEDISSLLSEVKRGFKWKGTLEVVQRNGLRRAESSTKLLVPTLGIALPPQGLFNPQLRKSSRSSGHQFLNLGNNGRRTAGKHWPLNTSTILEDEALPTNATSTTPINELRIADMLGTMLPFAPVPALGSDSDGMMRLDSRLGSPPRAATSETGGQRALESNNSLGHGQYLLIGDGAEDLSSHAHVPSPCPVRESSALCTESSNGGRESSTFGGESSTFGMESLTLVRESSTGGRESSTRGRESSTTGRESSTTGRESSTFGRESSTLGREYSTQSYSKLLLDGRHSHSRSNAGTPQGGDADRKSRTEFGYLLKASSMRSMAIAPSPKLMTMLEARERSLLQQGRDSASTSRISLLNRVSQSNAPTIGHSTALNGQPWVPISQSLSVNSAAVNSNALLPGLSHVERLSRSLHENMFDIRQQAQPGHPHTVRPFSESQSGQRHTVSHMLESLQKAGSQPEIANYPVSLPGMQIFGPESGPNSGPSRKAIACHKSSLSILGSSEQLNRSGSFTPMRMVPRKVGSMSVLVPSSSPSAYGTSSNGPDSGDRMSNNGANNTNSGTGTTVSPSAAYVASAPQAASALGSTTPPFTAKSASALGSTTTPLKSQSGFTAQAASAFGSTTPPSKSQPGSTAQAASAFGSTSPPFTSQSGSTEQSASAFSSKIPPSTSQSGSKAQSASTFGSTIPPSTAQSASAIGSTIPPCTAQSAAEVKTESANNSTVSKVNQAWSTYVGSLEIDSSDAEKAGNGADVNTYGSDSEDKQDEPGSLLPSQEEELPAPVVLERMSGDKKQEEQHFLHEVHAMPVWDPVSGQQAMLIVQNDITERANLEMRIGALTEAQLSMLEAMFPRSVLEYLMTVQQPRGNLAALAGSHDDVTVLFMDVCGFTDMSKEVSSQAVMGYMNDMFSFLDDLVDKHGVYKVDTSGDCYIVAGGLMTHDEDGFLTFDSDPDPKAGTRMVVEFMLDLIQGVAMVPYPHSGFPTIVRVGIHTGQCVSGLVGTKLPKFSLWGDTMNTASRMESTSKPGGVQISDATYKMLFEDHQKLFVPTGGVTIKGKGTMDTYILQTDALPTDQLPRKSSQPGSQPGNSGPLFLRGGKLFEGAPRRMRRATEGSLSQETSPQNQHAARSFKSGKLHRFDGASSLLPYNRALYEERDFACLSHQGRSYEFPDNLAGLGQHLKGRTSMGGNLLLESNPQDQRAAGSSRCLELEAGPSSSCPGAAARLDEFTSAVMSSSRPVSSRKYKSDRLEKLQASSVFNANCYPTSGKAPSGPYLIRPSSKAKGQGGYPL
eukprot:gene28579-31745_t